jgi:hypothetical protein
MSKPRKTASTITDDDLDELYDNAARGWRRGDIWKAKAVEMEADRDRADKALAQAERRAAAAEAAVARAERLARRWAILRTHGGASVELRAALAEPKESTAP